MLIAEMKRRITRVEDLENLELMIKKDHFNWEERYNKKYILKFANDWGLNKSRLNKAINTLDFEKRLIKNKLQRSREDQKRREKLNAKKANLNTSNTSV
jgi:hypothetical protein